MRRIFKYILLISLIIVFFVWFFCVKTGNVVYRDITMDTYAGVTIYNSRDKELVREAWEEFRKVDLFLDRYKQDSLLSEISKKASIQPIEVPNELFVLLRNCLVLYQKTGGSFNPAIGPLVDLWRPLINSQSDIVLPVEGEIRKAINLSKPDLIELNDEGHTIFFKEKGVSLDFGAVAKGYAVDRVMEFLKEKKVRNALIDGGGTIGLLGPPPQGRTLWRVAIKHPRKEGILGILNLGHGWTVSTSGDYERYNEIGGVRYHHILDPDTGYPTKYLISATVVSEKGFISDAYSTAIMVMGLEKGLDFLEKKGLYGVLVTPDLKVYLSKGTEKYFENLSE